MMVRLDDTRRVRAECNDVPDDGLPCPFTARPDSASYTLAGYKEHIAQCVVCGVWCVVCGVKCVVCIL